MGITRKAFVIRLIGSSWVLAAAGCGGGGGDDPPPATGGGTSACTSTISDNHGHVLVITAADLNSTTDRSFDIRGAADHAHTVSFTAAQLAQLKAGTAVTVSSSPAFGHDHSVSPRCT